MLGAFAGSSAAYWVKPAFPYAAMRMLIVDGDAMTAECSMMFHVTRGMWRGYFDGVKFANSGEFAYQIEATDFDGNRHVCGRGVFRVYASAGGSAAASAANGKKGE